MVYDVILYAKISDIQTSWFHNVMHSNQIPRQLANIWSFIHMKQLVVMLTGRLQLTWHLQVMWEGHR